MDYAAQAAPISKGQLWTGRRAILLTGYLGGAVAAQVRIGAPLFGYVLAPVYVALFLWVGLYLRDERVRAVVPVRR